MCAPRVCHAQLRLFAKPLSSTNEADMLQALTAAQVWFQASEHTFSWIKSGVTWIKLSECGKHCFSIIGLCSLWTRMKAWTPDTNVIVHHTNNHSPHAQDNEGAKNTLWKLLSWMCLEIEAAHNFRRLCAQVPVPCAYSTASLGMQSYERDGGVSFIRVIWYDCIRHKSADTFASTSLQACMETFSTFLYVSHANFGTYSRAMWRK